MDLLTELEAFYDAVPRRGARAERIGPLELFVREGVGWPYDARPALRSGPIDVADVRAVLARQAELAVPQAFEWVHEVTPSLTVAAAEASLAVDRCPLLVLDPSTLADADDEDLAAAEAIAAVAFRAGIGTQVGTAGTRPRWSPAARTARSASAGTSGWVRLPRSSVSQRFLPLDGAVSRPR